MVLRFDRAIVTDKRIALSSENVQHRTFYQLNYSFRASANKKQVAFQSCVCVCIGVEGRFENWDDVNDVK